MYIIHKVDWQVVINAEVLPGWAGVKVHHYTSIRDLNYNSASGFASITVYHQFVDCRDGFKYQETDILNVVRIS